MISNLKKHKISSSSVDDVVKKSNKRINDLSGEGLCFTEDTKILTKNGHVQIKDIKVGDEVYSANPETGEEGYKKVKTLYVHETDKLIHVQVGDEEIKATPTHPFWVIGLGWANAGDLIIL